MCSSRLDDPDPSRTPSSVTMTPPWTPKHDSFDDWTNQKSDNKTQATNQKSEECIGTEKAEVTSRTEPVTFTSIKLRPVTMDNFIESMFCHEMVNTETSASKADVTGGGGGAMTFGQIQETLIRRAMESAHTSNKMKTEKSVPVTASVKVSVKRSCDDDESSADAKTPIEFAFLTPTKNDSDRVSAEKEERIKVQSKKEEGADLTCHEKMEDISPVTSKIIFIIITALELNCSIYIVSNV